ncbi:family 43 glycosylhydrolase [Hymenobacter weizhouensis]|uniref:family 43 glycosylhydrolase n=1 Tax=Hymenobacter sp. YIM 151500-1 TaxID=2987689 RepID=UPI002227B648|nr:family 43 glycosylhydrolase [Hymenobacter sp. YIM 151500-1]UYZ62090.1 family 43 glycosylhydrolase [Hymenobacter sp. YIM 151500-1]
MTVLSAALRPAARWLALSLALSTGACQTRSAQQPSAAGAASAPTASTTAATIPNPVLPGDFPDPSVVKIGDTYWATATTSNWGPIFPLLKSKDLTSWELAGHVFPQERPQWADYYFWAPEISYDNGKTYVFYSAHQRGGNLAVGVASADRPEGPYTDHGPLVGQPDGSIDGFPMRDENGQLYLIWKEDGNSINQPTPIWAQRLSDDRRKLVGEKQELFRNNPATWEGNLVEGAALIQHNGYFYTFYAGAGCCGPGCTYATGVARSKTLLGPWEKYAKNPVLVNNDTWRCPGHGSVVQRDGRWYLLHHAYATQGQQFLGRQGVLSEFTWTADGWPEFRGGSTPVAATPAKPGTVTEEFDGKALGPTWQWPVEQKPTYAVRGGQLQLTARSDHAGAALGLSTTSPTYTATTTLLNPAALTAGTTAGLAAHGDPDNTLALLAGGGKLQVVQVEKGQTKTLAEATMPAAAKAVQLRLQAQQGSQFRFSWSADAGRTWQPLPADGQPINGTYLPPWDRGIRAGVLVHGPAAATASFDRFAIENQ